MVVDDTDDHVVAADRYFGLVDVTLLLLTSRSRSSSASGTPTVLPGLRRSSAFALSTPDCRVFALCMRVVTVRALLLRERDPREVLALAERSVSLYTELAENEPDVFAQRLSEAVDFLGR
ncbi:hypothetical protein OH799_00675 [Nocardia sp. NBC_00881]|uniref:hypothetical protein n=1 Tax=Nocardia sp. NBC_00881 TaxID=2975995 RepID=UPI003870470A|nr:hypothetical protein OH799_00675 [Nocardia sp. NBC_00881]